MTQASPSCPKCRCEMKAIQVKDSPVTLEQCPQCEGLWFDEGELGRLVRNRGRLAPLITQGLEGAERSAAHCPKCLKASLFTGRIPGMSQIEIESCASCRGIWLDRGEFHQVARECLGAPTPPAPPKPTVVSLNELSGTSQAGGPDNIPPQFEAVLDEGESVLWSGQPMYWPFLLNGVWLFLLGIAMMVMGFSGYSGPRRYDLFFALLPGLAKSLPFWLGAANLLRLHLVHGNTWYAATNRRLLLRTGFFGTDFKTYDYDKIADLEVNVNVIERLFGCGSIIINTMGAPMIDDRGRPYTPWYNRFLAITDPYAVFKLIKGVQFDVKTDIEYPNAIRPASNPGYKTKLG